MKSQEVSNIEFRKVAKEVKKLPRTNRAIQLLFWHKKGERSQRLLELMRELLEKNR